MKRITSSLLNCSLWLIAIGLTLSSSAVDGAYMARWMRGAAWLGYVLNTVSDVAGMVLTYWYGRLQQDRSTRKRQLARLLLVAEAVAVLYSWFFSWRQLLIVLPAVEADATRWVAPIAAGFIPLLLAFVGYAQALLAGRIVAEPESSGKLAEISEEIQPITGKREESEGKLPLEWESMSKASRVRWLASHRPKLNQGKIALTSGCSEGYVSKVIKSIQESEV